MAYPSPKPVVPNGLVVLTFDDGTKSMSTYVAPLLRELGFGATCFITDDPEFRGENYLGWAEVKQLSEWGFEIGNHLARHVDATLLDRDAFVQDVTRLERQCEEHGIPCPVTLAYPGSHHSVHLVRILEERGYLFARRGIAPEFIDTDRGGRGPVYRPGEDHPLLVPTTGASGPDWGFPDLLWAVDRAKDGAIAVLTFHGVPDVDHPWVHTNQDDFARYMQFLGDRNCTVVALRDLEQYVDPSVRPSDPYAPIQRRMRAGCAGTRRRAQ